MCGRFTLIDTLDKLREYFPIDEAVCEVKPNYNVAPTQEIPVIVRMDRKNTLDKYHWGLVPFWAEDTHMGNKMINARVETIDKKPAFRRAFKKRRCLIPASGFYEWKGPKGAKQPMYLTRPDSKPFALAGLWEAWDKKGIEETVYKSCTIITTEADESIRYIHSRMPVILKPESYKVWLDQENQDVENLKDILEGGIITELLSNPVSKRVNKAENNDPSNIKPFGRHND